MVALTAQRLKVAPVEEVVLANRPRHNVVNNLGRLDDALALALSAERVARVRPEGCRQLVPAGSVVVRAVVFTDVLAVYPVLRVLGVPCKLSPLLHKRSLSYTLPPAVSGLAPGNNSSCGAAIAHLSSQACHRLPLLLAE